MNRGLSTGIDRHAELVRLLHAELETATGSSLPVRLWDGTLLGEPADFEVHLNRPSALRAMLLPPSDLSAAEAYLCGEVDLTGDVAAALAAAQRVAFMLPARSRARLTRDLLRLPAPTADRTAGRARLRGRRHAPARDRAAIAYHYDRPAAFYQQFLDERLVYSCAYFADSRESLEAAQERKLELVCRKLRLRPGQRLLDIGCGFGSLLLHAARHHGVRAVGVTLSETQAEAGRERIAAAGLASRAEIRLTDYRELRESFDAVASIGMVEHVGPEQLTAFCHTVRERTEPGGLFLLHGIVLGDPRRVKTGRERTFLSTHVFPDGGLVPAWLLTREFERAGFALLDVEQLRPHYELTLRRWVARLEANHTAAAAIADEAAYRTWRLYMAASALSFAEGSLGVVQLLGANGRIPADPLPLGRAWMQP